jgi:hypothetical protein
LAVSWFSMRPKDPAAAQAARERAGAAQARMAEWERAIDQGDLPSFVKERLGAAAAGKVPWLSTMTPAELLLARSHGLRPLATVSATCWYQYGYSWTEGHAAGWRTALERLRREAIACGANAVVDVKMKTVRLPVGSSMDYSLVGTAVRFERLGPSQDPVIAAVPALEFVRLLEAGVVPTGLAVGACYEWMPDYNGSMGGYFGMNQPLGSLSSFWERIRRMAHADLREDAQRQGNGVLAHTHFGQLIKQEGDKQPDQYLGRHIVIGTVVQVERGQGVPHGIESVVDMRDDLSPLIRTRKSRSSGAMSTEREEAI